MIYINYVADNKKIFFLSGGGSEHDSKPLDLKFISSIRGSKILYIPVAMPKEVISYENCYDWITTTLTRLTEKFLEIDMLTDFSNVNFESIKNYSAIYIGGGNTYKLLQELQKNNFIDILNQYIAQGGIYYGGSAGAIIVGNNIATVSEENDNNYNFEKGLNLLNGRSVFCHYNGSQDEKIFQYVKKFNIPVFALPEKTGFYCHDGEVNIIGGESAYLFNVDEKIELRANSIVKF